MSLWDNLKEKASGAAKLASEGLTNLKDLAGLKMRLYQLETQIKQVNESQRAAYEAMGRRVFEMYKSGQIADSTLVASCGDVEAATRRAEELRLEEARLQKEFEAEQKARAASGQGSGASDPASGASAGDPAGGHGDPAGGSAGASGPAGSGPAAGSTGPKGSTGA